MHRVSLRVALPAALCLMVAGCSSEVARQSTYRPGEAVSSTTSSLRGSMDGPVTEEEAIARLEAQLKTGWIGLSGNGVDGPGPPIVGYVSTDKWLATVAAVAAGDANGRYGDDPTDHVQPVYAQPSSDSELVGYRLDGIGFVPLVAVLAILDDPEAAIAGRPLAQLPDTMAALRSQTEAAARASIEILRAMMV